MMDRNDILRVAGELISTERAQTYGNAKNSHDRIASLWSGYLGLEITGVEVAAMMVLLKISRSRNSSHADNWVDVAGYAALAGEMEAQGDV